MEVWRSLNGWQKALFLCFAFWAIFAFSQKISGEHPSMDRAPASPATAGAAPLGVNGINWGDAPGKNLKRVSNSDLLYAPRTKGDISYENIAAAEIVYIFERRALVGGDMFFDGADKFAQLKTVLTQRYGLPTSQDETTQSFVWNWDTEKVSLTLHYQTKFARTTLHFNKDTSAEDKILRERAVISDAQSVKKYLRDPASADWVSVKANDDGSIVCIILRANNGFGGKAIAEYSIDKSIHDTAASWNQLCAGKAYVELTDLVRDVVN